MDETNVDFNSHADTIYKIWIFSSRKKCMHVKIHHENI